MLLQQFPNNNSERQERWHVLQRALVRLSVAVAHIRRRRRRRTGQVNIARRSLSVMCIKESAPSRHPGRSYLSLAECICAYVGGALLI